MDVPKLPDGLEPESAKIIQRLIHLGLRNEEADRELCFSAARALIEALTNLRYASNELEAVSDHGL